MEKRSWLSVVALGVLTLVLSIFRFGIGFDVSQERFDDWFEKEISTFKADGELSGNFPIQQVVYENGSYTTNTHFSIPFLSKEPSTDTLFWDAGEQYVAVRSEHEFWRVVPVKPWLRSQWNFIEAPRLSQDLDGHFVPDIYPESSTTKIWVFGFLWTCLFLLGAFVLVWQRIGKFWYFGLLPILFFLQFHVFLPQEMEVLSIFGSEGSHGPWFFRNGLQAFWVSVVLYSLWMRIREQKWRELIRGLSLLYVVFLVQSTILDTQFVWDFSQPQYFVFEQWCYLFSFGLLFLIHPIGKEESSNWKWLSGIALVIALVIYFEISPDEIWIALVWAVLFTAMMKPSFLRWGSIVVSLCALMVYSFHKFEWKESRNIAKNSLVLGEHLSDFELEESLFLRDKESIGVEQFWAKNWSDRYLLQKRDSVAPKGWLATSLDSLLMEDKPFQRPAYWLISGGVNYVFVPKTGGLNAQKWRGPLLPEHSYLHEEDGCWVDQGGTFYCQSIGDLKKSDAETYIKHSNGRQIAIFIPYLSWSYKIAAVVLFLTMILLSISSVLFIRYRKSLLSSYVSKLTIYQGAGFIAVVMGLIIFIQFGILRFGSVQVELAKKEKAESVLLELNSKFKNGVQSHSQLEAAIKKFAYVFQTELQLYDGRGKLLVGSDVGGVVGVTHGIPTQDMASLPSFDSKKTIFVPQLNGVFAAWNLNGTPIGYLSVPYNKGAQRISEGVSEMQAFVSGGVLFLILGLIGLLVWMLRNRVTPIMEIQKQLANWEAKGGEFSLDYKRLDEFGALVKAFNKATTMLALREKEGAWKGIAQQIAHEIKNPLTPLRLGLQMLPLKLKNLEAAEKEELNKFVNGTLLQIDNMAKMAENFSQFARMPSPKFTETAFLEPIHAAQQTFNEQARFNLDSSLEQFSLPLDKDQWIRIWTNLFKNSIQAYEGEDKVEIKVWVEFHQSGSTLHIRDNASGIPKEDQASIFAPNFTTKSGGTGLGLAMVRRMIAMHGGHIQLKNSGSEGTEFIVLFK